MMERMGEKPVNGQQRATGGTKFPVADLRFPTLIETQGTVECRLHGNPLHKSYCDICVAFQDKQLPSQMDQHHSLD